MRTEIQLLKLLYNNIRLIGVPAKEGYKFSGLCRLINDLYYNEIISMYESDKLHIIINCNPTYYFKYTSSLYYYPRGNRFLRRIYVIKLIIKYSLKQLSNN